MAVQNTLIKANAAALYDEINNGAALTNTTIAANDLIGIADVSAGTGAKITINNLISFITNNYSILNSIRSFGVYTKATKPTNANSNYYWATKDNPYSVNVANSKLIICLDAWELEDDRYGYIIFITKTKIIRGHIRRGYGLYETITRTPTATTVLTGGTSLSSMPSSGADWVFWDNGTITYTGTQLTFSSGPSDLLANPC